jgi:4'-phosphopantetheinyl transferase
VPFTQEIIQFKNIEVHLMDFNAFSPADYLDQLTEQEKERFFSFKNINRQCEFVATRILRHRLFGFEHIHYDEHGAPYIENEGFISISHAPGVVGIALCKDFKIGLDLEPKRNKAKKLFPKFLSTNEITELDVESEDEMTTAWSLKEVLYKLAGRKKIIFKTDLLIEKVAANHWSGTIINPDEKIKVELTTFVRNDLIICVSSDSCKIEP